MAVSLIQRSHVSVYLRLLPAGDGSMKLFVCVTGLTGQSNV